MPEVLGPVCSRRGLRGRVGTGAGAGAGVGVGIGVGVGVGVRRLALALAGVAGVSRKVREERRVAADLLIDEHVAQLAQVDRGVGGVSAVGERQRDPRAILRLEALLQHTAQHVLPPLVPRGHRREEVVDAVGVLPRHLQLQLPLGAWLLPQHRLEQHLAWVRVTKSCARASARLRARAKRQHWRSPRGDNTAWPAPVSQGEAARSHAARATAHVFCTRRPTQLGGLAR